MYRVVGTSPWQVPPLEKRANRGDLVTGPLVEEVFAPAGVGVAKHAHEVSAGMEAEGPGLFAEFHSRFFGGSIAFAVVTGMAAGDEVFPGGSAGAGAGDDVVEGEFAGG